MPVSPAVRNSPMATPTATIARALPTTLRKTLRRVGPQCHPQTDFSRAEADPIGDGAVQTDRGEERRQDTKADQDTCDPLKLTEGTRDVHSERLHRVDANARRQLEQRAPHRLRQTCFGSTVVSSSTATSAPASRALKRR